MMMMMMMTRIPMKKTYDLIELLYFAMQTFIRLSKELDCCVLIARN